MKDGLIVFPSQEECRIKNILSNYTFKYPDEYKNVDEEYLEYEEVYIGIFKRSIGFLQ
jgi:hypothetical protein